MTAQLYFQRLYEQVKSRANDLNALDRALGDGDHGTTMARGLSHAVGADMGMGAKKFMRASGGASGTLFGLILHEIERHLDHNHDLTVGLGRALTRICDIGHVTVGDKSMVDALAPAVHALQSGQPLHDAIKQAEQGRDSTCDLRAKRGRAQYVENQGLGHIDPGAVSVVVLLQCLLTVQQATQQPTNSQQGGT